MSRQNKRSSALIIVVAALLSLGVGKPQDTRTEIVNLRYFTHPNFTRIVLDIGKLREYTSGELQQPGRIYLDVLQVKLNPILDGQSYPVKTDYLSQIVVFQKSASAVRVVMDVDFTKVKDYRAYHLFDPFRIVVDIYPRQPGAAAAPTAKAGVPPAKPADPSASGYSMARQLGLGVRTIVLDPGHGGSDPGCIGKAGTQEKDITLDISAALKKMLVERAGLNVIMARESDVMVPLESRTVIANQKRADLFVSIHINAHRDRKREGVETFFLNFSPDPAVVELAARENATSTKNMGQMKDIIQKIATNSRIDESRVLAERIQRRLLESLALANPKVKDLGVKGAPFWVLIGSEMPSVLVEISHLSNPSEESRLKTSRYRELAVQGVYNGIMDYVRSLGKG